MTLVSPTQPPDIAEVAFTESDLLRRLDMLTDEVDTVVVLGLIAAGMIESSVLDDLLDTPDTDSHESAPLDLERYRIPAAPFARLQRIWYHFRVPHARASFVWWYLFCLALGRDDDVGRALEGMAGWLGRLTGAPASVLPLAADTLGLATRTVVVTTDETGDLAGLALAVRLRAPLVAVPDVATAMEAGRAAGYEVVTARPAPDPAVRPWIDPAVRLNSLPGQARRDWQRLPDPQRVELLSQLQQRVTSIEQVRFRLDENVTDNRGVAAVLAECAATPVEDWPLPRLALATLMRCWHEAGFVLQELNQSFISFPATALFLTRRIGEYRRRLDEPAADEPATDRPGTDRPGTVAGAESSPETGPVLAGEDATPSDGGVIALAHQLGALRQRIEQRYERCLHFDGSNWERREFLLPLALYQRPAGVPDSLRERLYAVTGVEMPGYGREYLDAWDRFVEDVLAAGATPTRVLQEIAWWAANATDLPVDFAVFTVPLGTKLDQPWTMEFTDLFCYTGFRDDFDPKRAGVPMDRVGVHNILGQRMRYNAVKKAQNYAPVRRFPPQGFNLPDIAIAEDANHAGHTASGVRLASRVPITIRYRDRDWNGLSDVRLNRAEYRRENRFHPGDLLIAHRYAEWTKGVADATFRRGLQFDAKWGNKVTDLEI